MEYQRLVVHRLRMSTLLRRVVVHILQPVTVAAKPPCGEPWNAKSERLREGALLLLAILRGPR